MTGEPRPYLVEVIVDAQRDVVWRALTDVEQVRQWFGWDHEGIDGEIRYIFVENAEPEPPDRIVLGNGSYLELVADGPRTVVRAVLPGSLDGADWDEIYDGMAEGWRAFFEQLRFLLETRPQGHRRTVYLTGTATGAEVLALADADGPPWHTSRFQRMVVDPTGHLVGVASQAPLSTSDPGAVGVTITTYGLDDAAFATVRDGWADRLRGLAGAAVTTEAGETPIGA